ncbi:MAG: amidohydrolase family protein [Chloroflexi bacterium]|nr:amidohydrolase family protein [Chloroflexota bacterium]
MIIDLEHHFSTEEQLRKRGRTEATKIQRGWVNGKLSGVGASWAATKVEEHLKFMDAAGIDMAVLTTNFHEDLDEVKQWTNACARVVKESPKRFIGFAPTSALGGKPFFDEMERAVKDLGMKGIHINCRPGGKHMDSRELWPFYKKVLELGVPIDVHIAGGPGLDFLDAPYALQYVVAREFDIAAETLRICLGGVLEEFPNLVFIINHFGGGVSSVMERFDAYLKMMGKDFYPGKPLISKPWREYFNKLYFSMAGREIGIATTKCALTTISPKKLMFGTDWTWNFEGNPQGARQWIEGIRKLDLPKTDIDGILGGNAAKLLGI